MVCKKVFWLTCCLQGKTSPSRLEKTEEVEKFPALQTLPATPSLGLLRSITVFYKGLTLQRPNYFKFSILNSNKIQFSSGPW